MKNIIKQLIILLTFLFVSVIFFRNTIFSPGTIIGYDWALPTTFIQIDKSFKDSLLSWADQGTYLGSRNPFMAATPFALFIKSLTFLSIDGQLYPKLLLLILFTSAGFSMYSLARFFNLDEIVSVFTGLIYITTPIFFNYSIMGWVFVLIALALLPLTAKYFVKAVSERKIKYAIITGVIYSLSIIQSQSLVWFMIVFWILGIYLIKDRHILISYIRTLFIIILLFFLINSYWILGLIFAPDRLIYDTAIVKNTVSMGTMGHFYPTNIIRLWGGLINYQYENAINSSPILVLLSYLIPVLAFSALFIKENRRLIITFWLIGIVPLFIYFLNSYRDLLIYIPFSGGIRDFARFTVLSTFVYPLLAAFSLRNIFIKYNKKIIAAFFIFWIISIYPWWSGEISNWHGGSGCNGRFRTKIFPNEYLELEKEFSKQKLDQKSFYIPTGGIVYFNDDQKFYWTCNGIWDIFSGFSPIPGELGLTDRGHGYLASYIETIRVNLDEDLLNVILPSNIKYIIVRKNLLVDENRIQARVIDRGIKNNLVRKIAENKKIIIYEVNNFLPHFYTSRVYKTNLSVEKLPEIISSGDMKKGVILFEVQNKNKNLDITSFDNLPILEYRKESPAKYRIRVHQAKEIFPLVFLESFHDEWKAYIKNSNLKTQISKPQLKTQNLDNYKILNGNEEDQATKEELAGFIEKNWVTTLGDKKIDFVSRNFADTIQNDNLPNGRFWETWRFLDFARNDKVVQIPDENHLMVNGYANSWIIDPKEVCNNSEIATSPTAPRNDKAVCIKNPDASYDMELIVEFWPQRLFYIGGAISLITLISALGYLTFVKLRGIVLRA